MNYWDNNWWNFKEKELKKNIERIDSLKKGFSKENWLNSQIRINKFTTEAELKILKECHIERNKEIDKLKEILCQRPIKNKPCDLCINCKEINRIGGAEK